MHYEQQPKKKTHHTARSDDPAANEPLISYQQLPDENAAGAGTGDRKDSDTSSRVHPVNEDLNETSRLRQSTESLNREKKLGPSTYLLLRLLHSVLSGYNYGVALVLMLIAMTFNPSLFLALVIGYAFGDFIFYARMKPRSSSIDCH